LRNRRISAGGHLDGREGDKPKGERFLGEKTNRDLFFLKAVWFSKGSYCRKTYTELGGKKERREFGEKTYRPKRVQETPII